MKKVLESWSIVGGRINRNKEEEFTQEGQSKNNLSLSEWDWGFKEKLRLLWWQIAFYFGEQQCELVHLPRRGANKSQLGWFSMRFAVLASPGARATPNEALDLWVKRDSFSPLTTFCHTRNLLSPGDDDHCDDHFSLSFFWRLLTFHFLTLKWMNLVKKSINSLTHHWFICSLFFFFILDFFHFIFFAFFDDFLCYLCCCYHHHHFYRHHQHRQWNVGQEIIDFYSWTIVFLLCWYFVIVQLFRVEKDFVRIYFLYFTNF